MKKIVISCLIAIVVIGLTLGIFLLCKNASSKDNSISNQNKGKNEAICSISFKTNGGSEMESQKVENGELLAFPGVPTREGYTFVGWYTSQNFKKTFDFSKPIKKSCTLYARWVDTTDTTDTDGDGLTDPIEEFYNTDKTLSDTDGDYLSDYIEISVLNLDPLKKDTDGNGILDGNEDTDKDTLFNLEEINRGTNPALSDTDGDKLLDASEIKDHFTSPTLKDSDSDGADDGWEVSNSFNPLSFDSTFNVVVKAEPSSSNSAVVAQVQMETNGEQAAALQVKEITGAENALITDTIPGYLGSAYGFSTKGEIKSATITFEYNETLGWISDEFQPRIYYINEETDIFEELENQTIENGKVSVTVTHFSKYILLNKVAFDKVWETEIRPPKYEDIKMNGLDIVFVIDSSGSMDWNDESNLRHQAVIQFLDKLGENDRAAVIDFDSYAYLYQTFTNDKNLLIQAVNRVDSSGGTDLSEGIDAAIQQFTSTEYTRTDAYKYVVFLTDGDGYYSSNYTTMAAENGIVIFTIGLGEDVMENVLREIADGTDGKYYFASLATDLNGIYDEVSFETIDYGVDSNYDGISDYYASLIFDGKLVLSNGSTKFAGIDFSINDDYDGDGIKNGDELIVVELGDIVYMEMKSDPTKVDSDGDGYVDRDDEHPITWDVSYRDLALLSNAVYQNYAVGTVLSSQKCEITVEGYAGVTGSTSELEGWVVIESVYNPLTGFEAAAYVKDNNIVITTRGSEANNLADVLQDWILADFVGYLSGLNVQLPAMETFISDVADKYSNNFDNFYVTGHSLGGYLALMSSSQLVKHNLENKIKGVVTFNGLGMSSSTLIGKILDIDDNINLQKIRGVIKNYRTFGDVVSCIGYTPGDDVTIDQAPSLGGLSIINAHSLVSFVEQFSNELRKPDYLNSQYCYGLNDERNK